MQLTVHRGAAREYVEPATGTAFFSVTQVRNLIHNPYIGLDSECLAAARMRGSLLHRWFWRYLASRSRLIPEPELLVPPYQDYCQAIIAWGTKQQADVVSLESQGVNRRLGYAGTRDAQCHLLSRRHALVLLDLKTGEPTKTDPMQLVAYDHFDHEGERNRHLLDLYIHADGTYEERWVTPDEQLTCWAAFQGALNVLTWRLNHGL